MGLRLPRPGRKLDRVRKKTILGLAALAGIAAAAAVLLLEQAAAPDHSVAPAAAIEGGGSRSAESRFAALPPREGLSRQHGDPFGVRSAPAHRAAAAGPAQAAPAAPPVPTAPPMPYRVAGQLVRDGVPQVVLARDDRVMIVREGQVLDGGYRVESITPGGVTLVYTALDARETLPFSSVLPAPKALAGAPAANERKAAAHEPRSAAAQPATLRWEGPEQVQAGSNFNVALKITSHQVVRGSPVQLSFDAKLLEPVAVRAGDFFADGSFTYRVNPGGSIFVGAFGNGAVAADAEFLVVTFKPIRSGGVAELSISSMVLQGAAGSSVVHEPVAAFRTSITQ
jgi:hypothetical protein